MGKIKHFVETQRDKLKIFSLQSSEIRQTIELPLTIEGKGNTQNI